MPKDKRKKTKRRTWDASAMTAALDSVRNNELTFHQASKKYRIPGSTIRRYVSKNIEVPPVNCGRFKVTFTAKKAEELKAFLIEMDKMAMGLTRKHCRILVYDYAESENIPHQFSRGKKAASAIWFKRFLEEYNFKVGIPCTKRVTPESSVRKFFRVLGELRDEKKLTAGQIYHVKDMVYSLADSEERQIDADEGIVATILCCARGTGQFIPPFMIFPREAMSPELLNGAPSGTVAVADKSGSFTLTTFIKFLKYFSQLIMPTTDAPALLLVANHKLLVSPAAAKFAKEHNIILMGFPRNVPYKMEPLSRSFIGAMQLHFSHALTRFYFSHAGSVVTDKELASLFGYAFSIASATDCATRGFRNCGIEPFNPHIFGFTPLSD